MSSQLQIARPKQGDIPNDTRATRTIGESTSRRTQVLDNVAANAYRSRLGSVLVAMALSTSTSRLTIMLMSDVDSVVGAIRML